MVTPETLKKKGWFIAGGRSGDRTLDQQMIGLDRLFEQAPGKTILDAGCAEGLISIELARRGALGCHGLEIVPGHVEVARSLAGGLPCTFEVADLNEHDIGQTGQADIVLMLAILHKLRDPSKVCSALAHKAKELCVIRLPADGPVIKDKRSGFVAHDIDAVMLSSGFELSDVDLGHLDEWVGYYRRQTWSTT